MKLYFLVNARMPTKKAYGIQIAKMCEALIESGIDVRLVIPRTHASQATTLQALYGLRVDVPATQLPAIDWYGNGRSSFFLSSLMFMVTSFCYLLRVRFSGEESIVYTVDMDTFSFALLPATGLPCFAEMHNIKPKNLLTSYFFRNVAGVIAVNEEIRQELIETFSILATQVLAEPNGVDSSWFTTRSTQEAREMLELPQDQQIALYVGRFYEWKGLEILVPAAEKLPDVAWHVIGGTEDEFKEVTLTKNLPSNLYVQGSQPLDLVPLWLAAANVLLVLGTKKNQESYRFTAPMKVFEYMAASRPVVASRTPALESLVTDREVFWYEADDAQSLTSSVETVLKTPVESVVGQARRIASLHTWSARVERVMSFVTAR